MERVLIVAKTDMKNFVCVGGLMWRTNGSVRLMSRDGKNQPADSPFEIGQLWDIEYKQASKLIPPHVEDVLVLKKRLVGQVPNLREVLLQRVQPWCGSHELLFDSGLFFGRSSCYVSRSQGIPNRSTGYWLPDRSLLLDIAARNNKPYYQLQHTYVAGSTSQPRVLSVPYVGLRTPLPEIPAQTLVRVSLSRWWMTREMEEDHCYLQISGWYD